MKKEYDRFIKNINIPRVAHIKGNISFLDSLFKPPKPLKIKILRVTVNWNVGGLINCWTVEFRPIVGQYQGLIFTHEGYGLDKLLNQYGRRKKRKVRRLE